MPAIRGHAADEGDGLSHLLALGYVALEISRKGKAKARHQLVIGRRDLLEVDHVRFREDRAPSGDPRRVLRFEGDLGELFDGEAEPRRLLVEKRAVPAAHRVFMEKSFILRGRAAVSFEYDELRVLSADVYHASHMGIEVWKAFVRAMISLVNEAPTSGANFLAPTPVVATNSICAPYLP